VSTERSETGGHRPVPEPPKHPLTQPIPVVAGPAPKRRRRRKRGRGRLPDRPIVLVGPMAAGKTSLGRRLAKEMNVPFVDSDVVFQTRYGAITDFFAAQGEAEFRKREAEIIVEQLKQPGLRVFALGGGAVMNDHTRQLLREYPVVLLMTTQAAVLRTANLSRRPLLRDDPEAWNRILNERRHLYEEVADITFRTDRATKEQLTRRVIDWARSYGRREARIAKQQPNRTRRNDAGNE
jgi:shikimate kinase